MKTQKWIFLLSAISVSLLSDPVQAQESASQSVVQVLREEFEKMKAHYEAQIQSLQTRLMKLEEAQTPRVTAAVASAPAFAAADGEKEIKMPPRVEALPERGSLLEAAGLPRAEIFGARIGGFFVGSANYNSHIQMLPEFAGGAPALSDARRYNFRFDKFGLGVSKVFAPWLSASASMEIESHRDRHTHLITATDLNRRGCPIARACERFGAEDPEIVVSLDKFAVTGIAPLGNGLSLSLGRYDVPFGIERHDESLLLTATTSEVFRYGRPNRMTGFQSTYTVAPWLDVAGWVVNRWEAETTHDDFNDNNRGKSFGGRIGFTPLAQQRLLNVGLGGFYGPEQENSDNRRWVMDVDFTWTPAREFLLAGEFVYGREENVELRERGIPFARADGIKDTSWWGFYLLGHYDLFDWLGLSLRYGLFKDIDGARTGVAQRLQSWTIAPVVHLSRLIPELRPMGATYARSRHPIDWLDLKLEYRINYSNRQVFSFTEPGIAILRASKTNHQFQTQVVVNY
ncbi:MAG: outer membrane beta-barrel protein [Candidatus Binatia bacterium]